MKFEILDCTLRDGGYYTQWSFSEDLVKSLVLGLLESQVNMIELGYKSPVKGGKFRKCNDGYLNRLLKEFKDKANFCFMIDLKDFIDNGDLNRDILNKTVKNRDFFTTCRVAFKQNQIKYIEEVCDLLSEKGYDIIVNIIAITDIDSKGLDNICETISGIDLKAVYFADSYGNLIPNQIGEIYKSLKKTGKKIGFHSHDNLGLAFANSLKCVELGVNYIDTTVTGMGRGVGNLKTEQVLMNYGTISNSLLLSMESYFQPLKEEYCWGFSLPFMYSGKFKVHPLVAQEINSSKLSISKKMKLMEKMKGIMAYDKNIVKRIMKDLSACVIIPARYKSSRFPGKPLAMINDKEMIIHVCEKAEKAVGRENVFVATEDYKIAEIVQKSGFNFIITSDDCLTGTDRVAEASDEVEYDIYVNLQGDEPMVNPEDIRRAIELKKDNFDHVINCATILSSNEKPENKKIPKILKNESNNLVYASRNPIPGFKSGKSPEYSYLKQVCIYCFNKEELNIFLDDKKGKIEKCEDIEILRFLEKNVPVKIMMVESGTHAVDYPEDIEIIERMTE